MPSPLDALREPRRRGPARVGYHDLFRATRGPDLHESTRAAIDVVMAAREVFLDQMS